MEINDFVIQTAQDIGEIKGILKTSIPEKFESLESSIIDRFNYNEKNIIGLEDVCKRHEKIINRINVKLIKYGIVYGLLLAFATSFFPWIAKNIYESFLK